MSSPKHLIVNVEKLHLDLDNPRLPSSVSNIDQLIEYMARESAIEDLMESIAENGYFSAEPLIVFPSKVGDKISKDANFTVAEGNRRLTALKLLHNPDLYPRRKKFSQIASSAKNLPTEIPVVAYETREDTLVFLGFRHITGIKQWDPLQKSRYIEQILFLSPKDKTPAEKYADVAKKIGSRPHYVKRSLVTLAFYNFAESRDFFDIKGLGEDTIDYSLLLTALGYQSIRDFVSTADDIYQSPDALLEDEAKDLTTWIFSKDTDGETRLLDSRNIKKLQAIVSAPRALSAFRDGAQIDMAYKYTEDAVGDFMEHLYGAQREIVSAISMVADVEPTSEAIEVAGSIHRQASALNTFLKKSD